MIDSGIVPDDAVIVLATASRLFMVEPVPFERLARVPITPVAFLHHLMDGLTIGFDRVAQPWGRDACSSMSDAPTTHDTVHSRRP